MQSVLLLVLVVVAVLMVIGILLQQGKGASMGAAFGSGASQTLFGSQGSTSFLVKWVAFLAAVFFVLCLLLARLANQQETVHVSPTLVDAAKQVNSSPKK